MRTRETISGGFADVNRVTRTVNGGSPWISDTTNSGKRTVKTITDVVTPNFRTLKKCGDFLPLNPVTIVTAVEERIPGDVNSLYKFGSSTYRYTGKYHLADSWHFPLPTVEQSMIDAAVLRAAANAASAQWDVLTTLAEIRSTVDTLRGLAYAFNNRTSWAAEKAWASRGLRKHAWDRFREIWLTARYGVRPIIMDIKNSYAALRALNDQLDRVIGRGRQDTTVEDQFATSPTPVWEGQHYWRDETLTATITVRGWASHKFETTWSKSFGADPLVTAWELIPYSFIVDWFISIGDWVSTLRPRFTGSYEGLASSTKVVVEQKLVSHWEVLVPSATASGGRTCTTIRTTERYQRLPVSSVPFPPVNPELNLGRITDLATIFITGRENVFKILQRR